MGVISYSSNFVSLSIQRSLARSSALLASAFERLASGQRINRASDDAAGLAISTHLRSDARVFNQALRNGNDAISLLNVADGTLRELTPLTTRLKELATQSANGTFSTTQRRSLDTEADQLIKEFNRVVASADFNGRKLLDGLFGRARIQLGYGENGGIGIELGSELDRTIGRGNFGSVNVTSVANVSDYALADFNGDGKADVANVRGLGSNLSVRFSNGDGTLGSVTNYLLGAFGTAVASGDIDGDGDADLIASTATDIWVFQNDGTGTFSNSQRIVTGSTSKLGLGDVNGDGVLDLLKGTSGSLTVFLGVGSGQFSTSSTSYSLTGTTIGEIKSGDFNGDGRSDVLISTTTGPGAGGTATLFLGSQSGALQKQGEFGVNIQTLSTGDINHDGYLDFIAGASAGDKISVFLGNGTGQFSAGATVSLGTSGVVSARLVDLNNDGLLDILGGVDNGALETFYGNGAGTFAAASSQLFASAPPYIFDTADFSGDGALDLFYLGAAANLNIALANTEQVTSIARLDLTTRSGALEALAVIDAILQRLSLEQSNIGSSQSRILASLNNLSSTVVNYQQADGRLSDVDIAQESAELTRTRILQETASALLGQANLNPQLALDILRNSAGI